MQKKIIITGCVFLTFILLYFIIFSGSGMVNRYKLLDERDKIQKEIDAANAEIAGLKKEVESLKTSDFQIERYARDNYKMIKPGELIVKIEEDSTK